MRTEDPDIIIANEALFDLVVCTPLTDPEEVTRRVRAAYPAPGTKNGWMPRTEDGVHVTLPCNKTDEFPSHTHFFFEC